MREKSDSNDGTIYTSSKTIRKTRVKLKCNDEGGIKIYYIWCVLRSLQSYKWLGNRIVMLFL